MKFKKSTVTAAVVVIVVAILAIAIYYWYKKPGTCTQGTPCPPPANIYQYFPCKNLPGSDIEYRPDLSGNIPALETQCNKLANCASFNSDGHLKSVGDPSRMVSCGDMFVKVGGPNPPPAMIIPPPWATKENSMDTVINTTLVGANDQKMSSLSGKAQLRVQTDGNVIITINNKLFYATYIPAPGANLQLTRYGSLQLVEKSGATVPLSPSLPYAQYVMTLNDDGSIKLMDDFGNVTVTALHVQDLRDQRQRL